MIELKCFIIATVISTILYFPTHYLGLKYGVYAVENKRTVHKGKIVRIGGVAIFLGYMLTVLLFVRPLNNYIGLLLGGTIIFVEGLLDDVYNMKPKGKLIFQFIAATIVIVVDKVSLTAVNLPFGPSVNVNIFGYVITYLWIIGITNALNLIDGLDGLAGGFSCIILLNMSVLSFMLSKNGLIPICMALIGGILGFLFFNFHPAKIFMGDCGAQFLGYTIACLSLYGFKSTTFITLMIPLMLLFIPISDTLLAIVRRKLAGKKISDADKGHLHHVLMGKMQLGQVGAVLTIYLMALLFSITAIIYVLNQPIGLLLLVILTICFDLFIEYTSMVSDNYHPLMDLINKVKGK